MGNTGYSLHEVQLTRSTVYTRYSLHEVQTMQSNGRVLPNHVAVAGRGYIRYTVPKHFCLMASPLLLLPEGASVIVGRCLFHFHSFKPFLYSQSRDMHVFAVASNVQAGGDFPPLRPAATICMVWDTCRR